MAWDDSAPTAQEVAATQPLQRQWDSSPPTPDELGTSVMDKQVPIIGGTPRGYARGALGLLPTAGMVGGGILGSAAGPAGTAAGAGVGAMGGEALKGIGEQYLLGDQPMPREKQYQEMGNAALGGVAGEMGGQVVGKGLEAGLATDVGQKAVSTLGGMGSKIGNLFTGVPQREIETYAKYADDIAAMGAQSNGSTAEAADQVRQKFSDSIAKTRSSMNDEISSRLADSKEVVDAQPIMQAMEKSISKVDPDLNPEAHAEVGQLMQRISSKIDSDGMMSVQDANSVKQFLQDKASTAYRAPGQTGSVGTIAANVAKSGAAIARQSIDEVEPSIAMANQSLSQLHSIEDNMNMNLISPKSPEAGLLAAGSRGNAKSVKDLQDLGELTGTDMQGEAEKLAAMRTFNNAAPMPSDTTGKSVGRMGLASVLGYLAGGPAGAVSAGFLTSPLALKTAINAGRVSGQTIDEMLQTPQGRQILGSATRGLIGKDQKQ